MKPDKFPEEVTVNVWQGTSIVFGSASKLHTWADVQREGWAGINFGSNGYWQQFPAEQINHFQAIATSAANYVESMKTSSTPAQETVAWQTLRNQINGILSLLSDGRLLTTDVPQFSRIKALGEISPDAASLLYLAQRSDWSGYLQYLQQDTPRFFKAILQMISVNAVSGIDPEIHAKEIQSLKAQLRADSESVNKSLEGWAGRYSNLSQEMTTDKDNRAEAWKGELDSVRGDWAALKKVYDEDLALEAPTKYWKDRGTSSRWYSVGFGAAFLVVSAACLCVFVFQGIPYLHSVAQMKDANAIVLTLPVIVPGFIAIWVLRILGRLFAETLQLSIDAGERQTMVKTFLALMHDEQRGKALVTDEDRILILHSLFRPSGISSADDAPPVHWFDLLTQKLSAKK